MSLHQLQCALAELFTDCDARDQFDRDPSGFAAARHLAGRECEQLAAVSAAAIAGYAATLVRKRRAEAARVLPQTQAALEERFGTLFAAWAERAALPRGRFRYASDAAGFCRYLTAGTNLSQRQRAAVQADLKQIRTASRPRWLAALRALSGRWRFRRGH